MPFFVPMDWIWRAFPNMVKDKILFWNQYALASGAVAIWWIFAYAHTPEYKTPRYNLPFYYKWHLANKLKKGELTEEQYQTLINEKA
uniref:Uncharacterized protein n=1 Tax=Chromera velia CCMP2878 TaxID=1169474 RepID=A0A0G4HN39_9ALVE|eukprot:Cvel_7595.t1-p1 / transcript=Cvel_7595.t1 / gene=Cvel_7595 / organism=Chromera_velia_CCMP2878 / gene_product=hypothetical protein / transcript_product=hypothetical protein / location=Cvel_scaffold400:24316-24811(+) / protein_length=86 / sequence_SO=supercontig / SO=protein_coding / is_pseudo=false